MYIFKFSIFGVKCIRSLKTCKSLFSINQPCNRNKERSSHHIIFAFVQKRKSLLYLVEFLSVFFLRILRPEMNPFVILLFLYGWYHLKKNSFMRNSLFFFSLQTLCFFFLFYIQFSFHFDSRKRVEKRRRTRK